MLAPVLITPPSGLLVSLADMKEHLRVDAEDAQEESLISAYIEAAAAHFDGPDGALNRCLLAQTWRQDYECFTPWLPLPLAPVSAITAASYIDGEGASREIAGVRLEGGLASPFAAPARGASWPSVARETGANVSITFTAGYGAAADVPAPIKLAVKFLAAHFYENREAVTVGAEGFEMPMAVASLTERYRRYATN